MLDDDDLGATGTAALVLHGCRIHLRRLADKRIKDAIWIGALQLAGYKASEIRELVGLTTAEYREALEWLQEAVKLTSARDEGPSQQSYTL